MTKGQSTIHAGIDVSKDKLAVATTGGARRYKQFYQFQQSLADVCVTKAELWAIINEIISQSCSYVAFEKIPQPCIKTKISAVLEEV